MRVQRPLGQPAGVRDKERRLLVISCQANPERYLSLQPSPTQLSGTLQGWHHEWVGLSLPRSPLPRRPQPKLLGTEGLEGSHSTQNQSASCGKNIGRPAPSARWHRTEWAMMAKEGRRRLAAAGPEGIPLSPYTEPGWSPTPRARLSAPCLAFDQDPTCLASSLSFSINDMGLVKKKQFSLSKTMCICKYPVCAGCQGQSWEQSVAPATDLRGKGGN